jgi:hypothetical protein
MTETSPAPAAQRTVVEVTHPLVRHKLALLRDTTTPTQMFRQLVNELTLLLTYEATKDLATETVDIDDTDALPRLTAYYTMRVGQLPRLPFHAPGDPALGPAAERAARTHHALLLANHGAITAAEDLDSAVDVIEEVEETARLFFLLCQRSKPWSVNLT